MTIIIGFGGFLILLAAIFCALGFYQLHQLEKEKKQKTK